MTPDSTAPYDGAIQKSAAAVSDVTKASEKAASYLATVFDPMIREIADWGHEAVVNKREAWKRRNLRKVGYDVQQRHHGRVAAPRPIPLRLQQRIIDSISNEDDEIIQSLWTNLLDKATDPNYEFSLNKIHIRVLEELEPIEALILRHVREFLDTDRDLPRHMSPGYFTDALGINEYELDFLLEHMSTLGLFKSGNKTSGLMDSESDMPDITILTPSSEFEFNGFLRTMLVVLEP